MQVTNDSRFIIEKDAISYLKRFKQNDAIMNLEIAKQNEYSLNYKGDEDFKKFFRLNEDKVKLLLSEYKDVDLLLKNILWDELFENSGKYAIEILEKNNQNQENTLIIANMSPIEMGIVGFIFNELGILNVAYNFNKAFAINSVSKSLEGMLYILSYAKSKYFIEKTKEIVGKIKALNFANLDKLYIILDQNNNFEQYKHLDIDYYLQNQIGIKDGKNLYKLEKYPTAEFLKSKNIKTVNIFDCDNDEGVLTKTYIDQLKSEDSSLSINKISYNHFPIFYIGLYENYLLEQNSDYIKYKLEISKKAEAFQPSTSTPKMNYKKNAPSKNEANAPYIVMCFILVLAIIVSNLVDPNDIVKNSSSGSSSSHTTTRVHHYSSNSNWGGSSYNSNNSNSNIFSNKSTVVKSFGGGGFSKGSSHSS